MAKISLSELSVRFGEFTAVDNVSLDIDDGEFIVYLGPSGCGKTTTLRCIAGLEQATDGAVLFDGHRVDALRPSERNIAMVFQFVSLYPHLRVKDNIAFPLRARKTPKRQIGEKLDWISEVFKLGDIMHRYPLRLPPGIKQKVALARAVVREPNVLLLDEPLSALDERFREEMRWELGHLQRQLGFTTIYVTHDQREAMSLADRIVLMRDGRVVQVATPEQMYAEPATEFAGYFIGSPSMNFFDVQAAGNRLLLGRERLPLPLAPSLANKLAKFADGFRMGIRPQYVSRTGGTGESGRGASADVGACRATIVDSYSVGRERFFDFTIDDVLYHGVDPDGRGGGIRFEPEQMHFFDKNSGERLVLDNCFA